MSFFNNIGIHKYLLKRIIHPVGQGAFYTEDFKTKDGGIFFSAVYDCGGRISPNGSLKYRGLSKYMVKRYTKAERAPDIVFISHFHADHINGVKYLIDSGAKKLYIPYLTPSCLMVDIVYNMMSTQGQNANDFIFQYVVGAFSSFPQEEKTTGNVLSQQIQINIVGKDQPVKVVHNQKEIWEYDIFMNTAKVDDSFIEKLCGTLGITVPIEYSALLALKEDAFKNKVMDNLDEIKKIFALKFPEGHNAYSMIVLSTPIDRTYICASCLYTGDAPSNNVLECITKVNKDPSKAIDIIQSPHHGSKHNFHPGLYYRNMEAFISFGENNQYHHPAKARLNHVINTCHHTHLVTEDPDTKAEWSVEFM